MIVYIVLIDGEVDSVFEDKGVAQNYACRLGYSGKPSRTVRIIERLVYRG